MFTPLNYNNNNKHTKQLHKLKLFGKALLRIGLEVAKIMLLDPLKETFAKRSFALNSRKEYGSLFPNLSSPTNQEVVRGLREKSLINLTNQTVNYLISNFLGS